MSDNKTPTTSRTTRHPRRDGVHPRASRACRRQAVSHPGDRHDRLHRLAAATVGRRLAPWHLERPGRRRDPRDRHGRLPVGRRVVSGLLPGAGRAAHRVVQLPVRPADQPPPGPAGQGVRELQRHRSRRATRSRASRSRSSASTRSSSRAPRRRRSRREPATTRTRRCPGANGNVAIAGHRTTYGRPFNHVDQLKVGDTIVLTTPDGKQYTYQVTRPPFVTSPFDWTIIAKSKKPLLTLTTCHPKGSARERLVIRAELVKSEQVNTRI